MRQTTLMEKYPVFVLELNKSETSFGTVDDIAAFIKERIDENPKVAYIGTFNHLKHTQSIEGEIAPAIQGAVNVIFCFGFSLPNPTVLALRPRSIGICDMGDRFVVSFMEAPMPPANQAMESWVKSLRNP